MKKVLSEVLTMHTQSLIKAMAQHAFATYAMESIQIEGRVLVVDEERFLAAGRDAFAEVVAGILMQPLAAVNARTDFVFRPKVHIPQVPSKKVLALRESGNASMFTEEEMFENHCREMKMNELAEGAIKWYTTQFLEEVYRVTNFADDYDSYRFFVTQEMLARQIKANRIVLFMMEPTDYVFKTEGLSVDEIYPAMAQTPWGFVVQEDAAVMYENIPTYVLDPDDQDSEVEYGVELYELKEEVVAEIEKTLG